jgi:hypothetical protein
MLPCPLFVSLLFPSAVSCLLWSMGFPAFISGPGCLAGAASCAASFRTYSTCARFDRGKGGSPTNHTVIMKTRFRSAPVCKASAGFKKPDASSSHSTVPRGGLQSEELRVQVIADEAVKQSQRRIEAARKRINSLLAKMHPPPPGGPPHVAPVAKPTLTSYADQTPAPPPSMNTAAQALMTAMATTMQAEQVLNRVSTRGSQEWERGDALIVCRTAGGDRIAATARPRGEGAASSTRPFPLEGVISTLFDQTEGKCDRMGRVAPSSLLQSGVQERGALESGEFHSIL